MSAACDMHDPGDGHLPPGPPPTGRFALVVEQARGDGSAPVPDPRDADPALRFWRGFMAVLRGLSGMDKYERYLKHERRTHPHVTPMTPAQFWQATWAKEDRQPTARCC